MVFSLIGPRHANLVCAATELLLRGSSPRFSSRYELLVSHADMNVRDASMANQHRQHGTNDGAEFRRGVRVIGYELGSSAIPTNRHQPNLSKVCIAHTCNARAPSRFCRHSSFGDCVPTTATTSATSLGALRKPPRPRDQPSVHFKSSSQTDCSIHRQNPSLLIKFDHVRNCRAATANLSWDNLPRAICPRPPPSKYALGLADGQTERPPDS